MIITSNIVTGLTVAIVTLIITRWLNGHKEKQSELSKLNSSVTGIVVRMDGIESFSRRITNLEGRTDAQEKICDNNHKWDGIVDRRKKSYE
jgi:hypothetical protein